MVPFSAKSPMSSVQITILGVEKALTSPHGFAMIFILGKLYVLDRASIVIFRIFSMFFLEDCGLFPTLSIRMYVSAA